MRYIDYFIKCIIRRIVRIIFKSKILITILFILLILTISLYHNSYAAEGNIYDVYNSINNDLVNRLDKVTSSNTSFYNFFNNLDYSFLVFYGSTTGSSMFTSSYDSSTLNVCFYPSNFSFIDLENHSVWGGASCSQSRTPVSNTVSFNVFSFDVNGSYVEYGSTTLYLPTELINYRSSVVSEYLREKKNVQEITNSITEGTDKINDTVSDTNNFIKDDTISDDSMTIDTDYNIEQQSSIDNFFIDFLSSIHQRFINMNTSVETISIPLPYNMEPIVLHSDIISKHIVGTTLYTLVQLFWTFCFGKYIIMFVKRMFDWLSTGEIAEKGVFGFIYWLDNYNSIVKSWMM